MAFFCAPSLTGEPKMWIPSVRSGLLSYMYDRLIWPAESFQKEVFTTAEAIGVRCSVPTTAEMTPRKEYEVSRSLTEPTDWNALRALVPELDKLIALWNEFIGGKFRGVIYCG
jgi:hypothetical protein